MNSSRRPPAPPPALPGFSFVEVLGSGGFADVYLYEQQLPRRRVAVKVLLADRMSELPKTQFTDEANVMAMLSTHPAIVTIYQAGVADDGRPYLVMEYCPKPNLQVRYRQEPFSVAEALRTGIQVAAAVETAHRAGVLHRDIKPANILVTEYNRPALTDFGIASQVEGAEQTQGLSVPWSPPEAFADGAESGPRSDVWSLGATIYSLLAGRSPFERPGGNNSTAELMRRIEMESVPPIGRADVPATLNVALGRAMSKVPGDRFDSAVAFARALQKVQIELSHAVTPIDIVDDTPVLQQEEDGDDGTRVRNVVQILPQQDPPRAQASPAATTTNRRVDVDTSTVTSQRADLTRRVLPATSQSTSASTSPSTADDVTIARPVVPAFTQPATQPHPGAFTPPTKPPVPGGVPTASTPTKPRRTGLWIALGIGAVLVLGGIATVATLLSQQVEPTAEASQTSSPIDVIPSAVPVPVDVVGVERDGKIVFTWTNPDPQDGDKYLWKPITLDGEEASARSVRDTKVTVDMADDGKTCIDVQIVREDGKTSDATRGCV